MQLTRRAHLVIFALLLTAGWTSAHAETVFWLRNGTGIYPDTNPPTDFSETKNMVWKVPVGKSYSSPIIAGGSVFITCEPLETYCIDFETGKPLWHTPTEIKDLPKEQQGNLTESPHESGSAAATPAYSDGLVYSVFGNGMVIAYDAKKGTRVWTQAINSTPNSMEGRSASPIIVGDMLIVHLTELYAFDLKTGKQKWKQEKANDAYGTATAAKIGADDVIITPAGAVVKAADGSMIGSVDATMHFGGPLVVNKKICFVDSTTVFYELPDKIENPFKPKTYWEDSVEGQTYSTPLFVDGLIYNITSDGKMTIFNLDKKTKTQKQFELSADTYMSPEYAGKYIFIGNDKGKYIILEPGPDPKIVKTIELSEGSACSMAFFGKSIVLRSGETLYRFEQK